MKKILSIFLTLLLTAAIMTSTAVTTYADTAPAIVGDADGDGDVSVLDATVIQRHLANIDTNAFNEATADADGDGSVTILDATAIQRHIADLPTNERIGKEINEPVDNVWIDQEKAVYFGKYEEHFVIQEIYTDYFMATPIVPLPVFIKIHGDLSDHWCVGDHVFIVCDNVRYEDWRYEGDLVSIEESSFELDPDVAYKPVIYLYPEEETEVDVSLRLDGELLKSEPLYRDGWTVTAAPDGTLTDADGKTYDYLFWEAKLNANYDLSKGFCIKGSNTEAFLNDALKKQGLSEQEAADFIEFWLPIMEKNPYNVIAFQTDAYTEAAGLTVSPQPDTVIRVFMTWYASDTAVDIPQQELTSPARSGFTVVEWGGSMIRR